MDELQTIDKEEIKKPSKNKEMQCKDCGKCFTRRHDIMRHEDMHAGLCYHCTVCTKGFSRLYLLHRHQKRCTLYEPRTYQVGTKPKIVAITPVRAIPFEERRNTLAPPATVTTQKLAWVETSENNEVPHEHAIRILSSPDMLITQHRPWEATQYEGSNPNDEPDLEVARLNVLLDEDHNMDNVVMRVKEHQT